LRNLKKGTKMEFYNVEITNEALSDMEQIYIHIAKNLSAPENAGRQYERIAEAILKLNSLPERFQVIESGPGRVDGIRRMQVDNYSVFYVIRGNRVVVTNVLYSASDLSRRLKLKF